MQGQESKTLEKLQPKNCMSNNDNEVGEGAWKMAKEEEEAVAAAKDVLGWRCFPAFLPGTCNCPSGAPGYSD